MGNPPRVRPAPLAFALFALAAGCLSFPALQSYPARTAPGGDVPLHTARFLHPGILHNRAELDFVRSKVAAGAEPWKSAWDALRSSPQASLAWTPRPFVRVLRGPHDHPDVGAEELRNDAVAAYTQALEWSVTRDPAHADKAIEILDAYARSLKAIDGHDAPLLVGMSGIVFLNAAEIVRHTSDRWPSAARKRFRLFVREVLYPPIKDFTPAYGGNWDAAQVQTMLAMGVFLDDHELFNRALAQCLKGESNGSLTRYVNEFGQCQESGRDQAHAQMGLGFLGCACEIAWKQGVDLYGVADRRLARGFEYTAKYNLGEEVVFVAFPNLLGHAYEQISAEHRGEFAPIYEKIYRHYHDRLGLEMPYTRRVLERIRPEAIRPAHTPWGSLMFRELPPELAPAARASRR